MLTFELYELKGKEEKRYLERRLFWLLLASVLNRPTRDKRGRMMKHLKAPWNVVAIAVVALTLLTAGGALYAQQLTGNIFGNVTDESGARLPGVSVTLIGAGAPQTFTTDPRGEFRFLNVPPGDRY